MEGMKGTNFALIHNRVRSPYGIQQATAQAFGHSWQMSSSDQECAHHSSHVPRPCELHVERGMHDV